MKSLIYYKLIIQNHVLCTDSESKKRCILTVQAAVRYSGSIPIPIGVQAPVAATEPLPIFLPIIGYITLCGMWI